MSYTANNPLNEGTLYDDGTTVADMNRVGDHRTHFMPKQGRFPAFVALAKATGGVYAENNDGMTVDRALEAAGLDFTVSLHDDLSVPVVDDHGVETVKATGKFRATVASLPPGKDGTRPPRRLLGVVGRRYELVQPTEAAEFGQQIIEESGGSVVAVGAYGDPTGSRMYMALRLPEGIKVGGIDPHDLYLTIGNSFGGDTGLWGCVAPIRLDCTNQVAATFGKLSNRFSIRHTANWRGRSDEVGKALAITGTWTEQWLKASEQLLATPLVGSDLDGFLESLMPTPRTARTETGERSWQMRRNQVANLAREGENNTVGRGTAYAAYQAVAEWADHSRPARNQASRLAQMIDGGIGEQIKVRAAHLLLAA
jgi:phage/plasmid-like protein (TIGR03299 family)